MQVLTPGKEAGDTPPQGYEVRAHYTGTLERSGEKFDSSRDRGQPFKFTLGVGQVIKAWDVGFANMQAGERCLLKCRADYAYGTLSTLSLPDTDMTPATRDSISMSRCTGDNPNPGGIIKAGDTLIFDCELLSFSPKKKELWEMSDSEKLAEGSTRKEAATSLFKQQQFLEAAQGYEDAASMVSPTEDVDAAENQV